MIYAMPRRYFFIILIISYNHDLSFSVINYAYNSTADGEQAFRIIFVICSLERLVLISLFILNPSINIHFWVFLPSSCWSFNIVLLTSLLTNTWILDTTGLRSFGNTLCHVTSSAKNKDVTIRGISGTAALTGEVHCRTRFAHRRCSMLTTLDVQHK